MSPFQNFVPPGGPFFFASRHRIPRPSPSHRNPFVLPGMVLAAGVAIGGWLAPQQATAATSQYSVRHDFSFIYNDVGVKGLQTQAGAGAFASWGPFPMTIDNPPYNSGSAFLPCFQGQNCFLQTTANNGAATPRSWSNSDALANITVNQLGGGLARAVGHTLVNGTATATNPAPRRRSFASANSTSKATLYQGIVRRGRFHWRPIISASSSGRTSSTRWHDPVSFTITDPSTQTDPNDPTTAAVISEGDLLKITYTDYTSEPKTGLHTTSDITWSATDLSLAFVSDGLFSIDILSPYVQNPGSLLLEASMGKWITAEKTGRFAGVTLPDLHDMASWSIPLAQLYGADPSCPADTGPDAVTGFCVEYDFSAISPTLDLNLSPNGDGFSEAEEVPAPLPIIGMGATFASLRKLKSLSAKMKSYPMG